MRTWFAAGFVLAFALTSPAGLAGAADAADPETAAVDEPREPAAGEGVTTAQRDAARLRTLLNGFDALYADVIQRSVDGRGVALRESRGRLWVARPNRFRWEVDTPFAEVLVGDGELIHLWDPDLEQVTIRPYDERLAGTPARLLTGSLDELLAAHDVARRGEAGLADDGRERFALIARDDDALFERMELLFVDGSPRMLSVSDRLGQRTEVLLQGVRTDVDHDADRFRFEVPAGADVIREAAVAAPGSG